MDFLTSFVGRLHPLLVHLPIGVLVVAFLFECLSVRHEYRKLKKAVGPSLFWGFLFATAAAISGYFLRDEGGYDDVIADRHQNFGIATAVLALVVYVLRSKVKYWINPRGRKAVKIGLFIPLMTALVLTGHWGGSLTHGEDYLFAALSASGTTEVDPRARISEITEIDSALLYPHIIQPILEARCFDCHSSRREKGKLRLDDMSHILRGGESGPVIAKGPADSSALYKRIILPIEHDDHMPPREKPQLTSAEIDLIRYWVQEGADFERPVRAYAAKTGIFRAVRAMRNHPAESWVPQEEIAGASDKTLRALRDRHIHARPIAKDSPYLMVSFAGTREVSDAQLAALVEIGEQLVWLNLSHTLITDDQLSFLTTLTNLRVLYLNNTSVSSEGLRHLSALPELRWLNLSHTTVDDMAVDNIRRIAKLSRLYLFNTAVTAGGTARISEDGRNLQVDTGNYALSTLASDTTVYRRPQR